MVKEGKIETEALYLDRLNHLGPPALGLEIPHSRIFGFRPCRSMLSLMSLENSCNCS
jgi:hypothetical protein